MSFSQLTFRKTAFFSLLLLLLAGCGSSQNDFVFTSTPSDSTSTLTPVVVARLNVGDFTDVAGANIRLLRQDGSLIAQQAANANGHAYFENLVMPENFTAVASVPGSDFEFCAEIRNYRLNNKHAYISLLTTLACRYHQAHPELTIDQAETRLKQALAIPGVVDLAIGPQAINPFFSDIAFFRAASQEGGIETLLNQLMAFEATANQNVTESNSRSFLLTLDQLDRPLPSGGLDPALLAQADSARQHLAQRLGVSPATGDQLGLRYSPSISFVAGPSSLGGQFLLGIGTGLGGNLLTAGVNAVVGWAANQLGLNYGTAGQLAEIEGELNQLTSLVKNFTVEYTTQTLTDDYNTITGYFTSNTAGGADVSDNNDDLKNAVDGANPTGQPFVPGNSVVSLNNELRSNFNNDGYKGALNLANTQLSEQTGFLKTYQESYTYNSLGIADASDAASQNMSWRSNHILDVTNAMFEHFAHWQLEAMNLIAEASHVYPNNPVTTYSKAEGDISAGVSNLKSQRQLLPLYASQWGAIVDLDNGIMWWETFYGHETWDEATSFANGLSIQLVYPDGSARTYDDWRLPLYPEFKSLQNRGRYNPTADSTVPTNSNNGVGDTGRSTAGLPSLGFYQVADSLNAEDTDESNDNGSNGDLWMNEPDSEGDIYSNYEFRMNHADNDVSTKSNNDQNVYVLCRTFGPNNLTWDSTSASLPSIASGSALTDGEIMQWGVPTAVTVSHQAAPTSVTYPPNAYAGSTQNVTLTLPQNALEFVANITYQITLGGTFTVGAPGAQDTYSTVGAKATYTGSVSTATNTDGPNYLAALVNWSSSNSALLQILNLPYVDGIAIPKTTSGSVTVTASLRGNGGTLITGTQTLTPTAATPHVLESIQITPRNVTYGGTGLSPATGTPRFYVTGFYSDKTIADLSNQVTWTVSPFPNASNAQIQTDSGGAFLNLSPSTTGTTTFQLTINASIPGPNGTPLTDSTTVEITPVASVSN